VRLTVEFCGEVYDVADGQPFFLGREGDVVVDDNPYLHRRFLAITHGEGIWWLENVGTLLSATVADVTGLMQAYLAPGGRLPLVFPSTTVWFTAGPTTYEFAIIADDADFAPVVSHQPGDGTTTIGRVPFTMSQRLLILALAEPVLRGGGRTASAIPSSAAAAKRLGWPITTFNRKLDNVCDKLSRSGVKGLHAPQEGPRAVNRRARLVEYAVASRLVTPEDLPALDREKHRAPR